MPKRFYIRHQRRTPILEVAIADGKHQLADLLNRIAYGGE